MALIRWEPVPVNRFFNSFFDTSTLAPTAGLRRWTPAIDVVENEAEFVLRADLPGLVERDIAIEFEDDVLTVSGERRSAHDEHAAGYHRIERSSGSFRRAVRLPEGIDPGAVSAHFENGVLEVTVPKPEERKPRKVAITIGTHDVRDGQAAEIDAAGHEAESAPQVA